MAKRDEALMKKRHVKFVEAYVECEDAYEAARRAGFKEHQLDGIVEKWVEHPDTIKGVQMLRAEKKAIAAVNTVSSDWILAQLKDMYARASGDGDNANALKALDMLAKHVGLYAADKNPSEKPVTVVITNYAGVKIEKDDDGKEIS